MKPWRACLVAAAAGGAADAADTAAAATTAATTADGRFDAAYAACSGRLLALYAAEVAPARAWPVVGAEPAHFPAFGLLVGSYGVYRESTLCDGVFDASVKQVVCACIAASNQCSFCSNGHAICARLGGQGGAFKLVRERTAEHIHDPRLRSICQWALAFPDAHAHAIRNPPPLAPRDACELLGSILHVLYKNVFVKIFVGLSVFPEDAPRPLRVAGSNAASLAVVNRLIGLLMARPRGVVPGRMKEVWSLLPTPFDPATVALPADLWWAAPNQGIADAIRFMVAEHERVERAWLLPAVAACVRRYVATEFGRPDRDAEPPWAAAAATPAAVGGADNAFLASFLLTVGLAAESVDAALLDDFRHRYRRTGAAELMLKEVVSWASWLAARRVVGWMAEHASPRPDGST